MGLGYRGRILRVDLGERTARVEERDDCFYRTYLGGKGLVGYYLLNEVPPRADAFGPENALVFATGVMAGTAAPGFSRVVVGAKSPLTDGYGESEVGGSWGIELKRAGYDALVVQGCSEEPVYLAIADDEAQVRSAGELWGCSTSETEVRLAGEFARRPAVMSIGPAGERLVRFACIMQGDRNAAGRGGLGAVMGAKKLKAIAVSGSRKVETANASALNEIASWFATNFKDNVPSAGLRDSGTAGIIGSLQAAAILPTRNFRFGQFDGWSTIAQLGRGWGPHEMKARGCRGCPIRCKRTFKIGDGSIPTDVEGFAAGPEYETIAAFGSNLCIDDLTTIVRANVYCNQAGMDTISAGMTLAFILECRERGLVDDDDLRRLDARFGNPACVLPLLEMICERRGIGELLAEGSMRASREIGRGSERFAMHVKGQELPMHDPRGKTGVGIGYATADHGADHMTAGHDPAFTEAGAYGMLTCKPLGILEPVPAMALDHRKVRLYLRLQMWWDFLKCLGACFFCVVPRGLMPVPMVVDGVRAATGWDFSLWEGMNAADRAACMARAFNVREGHGPERDRLPARLAEGSGQDGTGRPGIDPGEMDAAVRTYYEMRHWDPETGCPTDARLKCLGIEWVGARLRG
ncbi:MAG: aldehyde ferredoxin oxidoreductase family protein [Firmicutes bacterium]|jgi:aldehyde:ferredoxin oxidoreductase|nr:aldehyde ferredoxin oxidoreductase family protein [Bacillota bacterium]